MNIILGEVNVVSIHDRHNDSRQQDVEGATSPSAPLSLVHCTLHAPLHTQQSTNFHPHPLPTHFRFQWVNITNQWLITINGFANFLLTEDINTGYILCKKNCVCNQCIYSLSNYCYLIMHEKGKFLPCTANLDTSSGHIIFNIFGKASYCCWTLIWICNCWTSF